MNAMPCEAEDWDDDTVVDFPTDDLDDPTISEIDAPIFDDLDPDTEDVDDYVVEVFSPPSNTVTATRGFVAVPRVMNPSNTNDRRLGSGEANRPKGFPDLAFPPRSTTPSLPRFPVLPPKVTKEPLPAFPLLPPEKKQRLPKGPPVRLPRFTVPDCLGPRQAQCRQRPTEVGPGKPRARWELR